MMITDAHIAHIVHYAFEWAALATGLCVYRSIRKSKGQADLVMPGPFAVIVGALLGAGTGSKLAFWLDHPHLWSTHAAGIGLWLTGQSIVGALLGGWLGVEIGKRISGISARTGDDYVAPILSGIVIGRIGCFLAGIRDGTFGLPTTLPWSVDFGDGIPRHPTQLYECLLALVALATWPRWRKALARTPGLTYRVTMLVYMLWRVFVDMLKPVPYSYALGLSGLQWLSIVASLGIILGFACDYRRNNRA